MNAHLKVIQDNHQGQTMSEQTETILGVLGIVVLSGLGRVAKNLPSITFSLGMTTFIDLVHLGFAGLLGVLCLGLWVTGRGAWREDG